MILEREYRVAFFLCKFLGSGSFKLAECNIKAAADKDCDCCISNIAVYQGTFFTFMFAGFHYSL